MAKVSAMPAVTAGDVVDADEFYILDGGVSKKISAVNLAQISQITSRYVAQSTLTTDGDVLTRASGSPARITRADLAQDTAFSSRYKPLASDYIWLTAGAFGVNAGSPSLTVTAVRWSAWLLDSASTEAVTASFIIPPQWSTFDIDIYWSNHSTGSGDVRYGIDYDVAATNGTTLTTGVLGAAITATAGLQDVLVVSRIVSGAATTAAGRLHLLNLYRSGANAADTLGNDAAVLGVLFTRAS